MRYHYDHTAVRRLAKQSGLEVQAIAARAGVSRQALSDVLHGKREPKASTLAGVASALGVDPGAFFRGKSAEQAILRAQLAAAWARYRAMVADAERRETGA